jgi:hypothetical protein
MASTSNCGQSPLTANSSFAAMRRNRERVRIDHPLGTRQSRRHHVEPGSRTFRAPMTAAHLAEFESIFCANPGCVLHVRPGDVNVRGSGNWAQLADGIILGRRRVDTIMLCDRCAASVPRGDVILARRSGVSAA